MTTRREYPTTMLDTQFGKVKLTVLDPWASDDLPLNYSNSNHTDEGRQRQQEPACLISIEREAPVTVNGIAVYGHMWLEWRRDGKLGYSSSNVMTLWRRAENNGSVTGNIHTKLYALDKLAQDFLQSHAELVAEARAVTLNNRVAKLEREIEEQEKELKVKRAACAQAMIALGEYEHSLLTKV
jgi:hypothetical protein